MSLARANGFDVIFARIELPRRGSWNAVVELDTGDSAAPGGAIAIEFATSPSVAFVGTVEGPMGDGSPLPGRSRVYVRAGADGLAADIDGKPYENVAPLLVVQDIVEDAGEVLDVVSGLDIIQTQRLWVRPYGEARKALSRFLTASNTSIDLESPDELVWRMRPSGRVEILRDTWLAYSGEALLEAPANEMGRATYALDAPDLMPGMTLESKKVSRVVHCIRRDGTFRSEVTFL